ncbi:TetR/AcrR family transcriptional regulator [Microbacterium sp. H1-D42]|uniref:TetR/AcrR family transcriptional regulator n=1 Tax=Microbacterium sp. H1-D42 TaxID=2925844 RepID=UPI001F5343B7|nr:TetR/AcrR family transcriptional regulator [Microbacterium sp. H1-D42]UNK71846.1 TetR/AcrR family transcriptional regulator [Microbacterium sp. H1-D42]
MIEIPESVRARGYATGNATKQLIVARAAEAFAQTGFYGTSLRAISREAGVDHSTLLHHFGSKVALLLAVLEWHDTQSMPADLPDEVTAEVIVAGFAAVARQNEQTPGLVALLSTLSAEAGASDHPARAALRERHEIIVGIIGSAIRAQRDAGAVADDGLTPEQSAAVAVATWEGLQVYSALHPGELDVPAIVERTLRHALGLS